MDGNGASWARASTPKPIRNMDADSQPAQLRVFRGQTRGSHLENAELRRRVVNYLLQRMADLDGIEVVVYYGTAIVSGNVPSQSVQWRCLECCRHVAGVTNVIDRLVVLPECESRDGRRRLTLVAPLE